MTVEDEGKSILERRVRELESLDWNDLDELRRPQVRQTTGQSGRVYIVRTYSFWDTKEWASGLYVKVKVYTPGGLRSRIPWAGHFERGGPDDPVPARPDH